jgi:hypothetical protein
MLALGLFGNEIIAWAVTIIESKIAPCPLYRSATPALSAPEEILP